jgi:hypothetical protein
MNSPCSDSNCSLCDKSFGLGMFVQDVEPIDYAVYGTRYFVTHPEFRPYDGLTDAESHALCEARCALIELREVWKERNEAARLAR